MFYATAFYLATPNPQDTCSFLQHTLGFELTTGNPILSLSNGSLELRLTRGNQPAILELLCSNIEKDSRTLLNHESVHKRTEIANHNDFLEQHLYADCGVTLILIKHLSEDDKHELLPLPTTLVWKENLISKAQHILLSTPLAFREQARKNMTEQAEYLAVERGDIEVQEEDIIQAFVKVTPPFQYQTLYESMKTQDMNAGLVLNSEDWINQSCSNA